MKCKAFFLFALCFASASLAKPPNDAFVDGQALEYDGADLRSTFGSPIGGTLTFGPDNLLTNLYVTWDFDNLSIALNGTIGALDNPANKMAILIDVDPGNGTGAEGTANWTNGPGYITYNDAGWLRATNAGSTAFGLDYMVASEGGGAHNLIRVIYDGIDNVDSNEVISLVDSFNNIFQAGVEIQSDIKKTDATYPLNALEVKIPWSVIYGGVTDRFGTVESGEVVPRGASLRMFAIIHNNVPASPYSSSAILPDPVSGNASLVNGIFTSDDYVNLVVDGDNDGWPDVDSGDVNAPWIRLASGASGAQIVFVQLNEGIQATPALDTNNWWFAGAHPASITMPTTNTLLFALTNGLPAVGTPVLVQATNIADEVGNSRGIMNYLMPSAGGLTNPLTVRFYLESNSGLGINPGASNFFINGGSFPLEFGFPPAVSAPMQLASGTLYYRDVVFPPGTPTALSYKYSGQLDNTGTNNYEAVRLDNFADKSRVLTLDPNLSTMVITDYLGAAAGPWRVTGDQDDYSTLYSDTERGAAGVRQQVQVTFTLNLQNRDLSDISRVIVQGTDPLRGFNVDGTTPVGVSDYAGSGAVGWNKGGVELYDDGSNGDTNAADGIFMRTWLWSLDGLDAGALFVPDAPNSLVGGAFTNLPFAGSQWLDGRSPRSFKYKFYVVRNDLTALESPASDIEFYLEDAMGTNVDLSPFVWSNEALPPPPPSNSPTMGQPVILGGGQVRVLFSNLPSEGQHGVLVATNLLQGWMDFGQRAAGSGGNWTAVVANANPGVEHYAAYAGPAQAGHGLWFHPNPLPDTGGILRVWYRQHSRSLAGSRAVGLTGPWNGWGNGQPMIFAGNGAWYYDLDVGPAASTIVVFKARATDGNWDTGPDVYAYKSYGRMTWTPNSPTNGGLVSITYNANGGPLSAATNVNAHVGFEESWFDAANHPMTNVLGETNIWEIALEVPTNRYLSLNVVFNNGPTWDSEGNPANGGRQNRIFISPPPYGVAP